MENRFRPLWLLGLSCTTLLGVLAWSGQHSTLEASSHREAPLIADDPLADNTDLYAFRSPDNPDFITIIANYIPLELPQGGPNYNTFGENIRYEIHIKNKPTTTGDDFTYRFTFTRTNQDPTTFFNIRLGQQNLKTTYTMEASAAGGAFTPVITNGVVPPPNVGPRSITGAAGLNAGSYNALMTSAIQTLGNGAKVFCGPVDDPFFADLGGIFDLGGIRAPGAARDGLARKNTHAIALQIPISALQKDGKTAAQAANILDSDFVIGVWASASRPAIRTLNTNGTQSNTGAYVQVSRLGMPLTNEVINPIGAKDAWNFTTPYAEAAATDDYLSNPELGLYMATGAANGQTYYGSSVLGLAPLRIQTASLAGSPGLPAAGFDFRNGAAGLSGLAGNAALNGTALAANAFGPYLLRAGKPRSVDILPIFHTGVPNLIPYQLATGKTPRNPLTAGKPFINNFLLANATAANPGGDMLRLNMAVPPTPRNSPDFNSEGLLYAAVLGLTDPRFNANATLQNIPNMDGFPNGRRLEDDVTRIELQAVGGAVLAAIGLFYDDYTATATNPVTPQLLSVVGFNAGITANDTTLKAAFPYAQTPWSGTKAQAVALAQRSMNGGLNLKPELASMAQNYPNPFVEQTTFSYQVTQRMPVTLTITDLNGRFIATPVRDKVVKPGAYEFKWQPNRLAAGMYVATLSTGSTTLQSVKLIHNNQ
ncbi:DUF4331 domain-containing protein [Hymenobacter busanensis]|uniref:DUF4331 domain-containing protein n=1 Tax=Hymenobacter busanensis TaxID=2607656 RepID=A0A7L5A1H0_9BACT|nr:DUF4331 family protein [Hymenobacter busanensis]KAA9338634.1 DUF4331 domain-containing protein [Hymenobacter busanensis]QHJ08936.1 DUF4331 domain-containing protein [Hymenobacter busanensis]